MALNDGGKVLYRKEDMDKILATFKKWDVNGNGSISKSELSNILDHIGVADKDRDSIFESIDTSRNGRVEYEEFVAWLYGTLCPMPIRASALSERYQLVVNNVKLDLEDDPSFAGWFHDASSIRPFLVFSDSLTKKRYFQSSEGLGLKSHLSFDHKSKHELWQFELGEGLQGADVEICLPKAMQSLRGHQVLGKAALTLDWITPQIAEGLGSATIFLEAVAEGKDPKQTKEDWQGQNSSTPHEVAHASDVSAVSPASQSPRSSKLVARITMKVTASGSLWARRNVDFWKQHGLPDLDPDGVSKVLNALSVSADRPLVQETLRMAEVNLAKKLKPFRSWTGSVADKELNEVLLQLQKLEQALGASSELRRQSSKDCQHLQIHPSLVMPDAARNSSSSGKGWLQEYCQHRWRERSGLIAKRYFRQLDSRFESCASGCGSRAHALCPDLRMRARRLPSCGSSGLPCEQGFAHVNGMTALAKDPHLPEVREVAAWTFPGLVMIRLGYA